MLPLNDPTIFSLVLAGVALLSAVAFRFGWKVRAPLLLMALALPAVFLWSISPTGDHAGLGYVITIVPSIALLIVGAGWGSVMRLARVSLSISILIPVIVTSAYAGRALWNQYVPNACLGKPLQVRVAGETLSLPPELRPRLEKGRNISFFGRLDRKSGYSRICRVSRNGAQEIDMDVVWINPRSNYPRLTSACEADEAPDWCGVYSPYPYRHIGKVIIAPDTELDFPSAYWREGGSLRKVRQGDLTEGSVCLLFEDGGATQCWVWQPFGNGSRLTVSTSNLDPAFVGMPVQQARDMTRQALGIVLSIITPSVNAP